MAAVDPATDRVVWDDRAEAPRARLAGDHRADCVVIGLGGTGLTCLEVLRRHGVTAIGLDAERIGGGAAGRNGGFLLAGLAAFHHRAVEALGAERATRLYRHTLAEVARIAEETPEAVRRTGSLRIAADEIERTDCSVQYAAMRAAGLPAERYLGPEGDGLLFPDDAAFQPLWRCRLLAERLERHGVALHEHSPVLELAPGLVRTSDARIRCDTVIVAVDGRLPQLLPELGDRVRSVRLQMLATAPVTDLTVPRPVYYRWGFEYWQQLPDGRIALGGFRDQGGDAEWTDEPVVTAAIQDRLEVFLRERLGVEAPITHRWAGIVSYTDGVLPVIEEVRPGLWAMGGYNGTGNVVGALAARAVADRVANGVSPLLHDFTR